MEKLLELLTKIKPEVEFEKNEHLIDEELLDSFDIISIVSEIGYQFDVHITASEIIPENFNSAKKIYELIEKLKEEEE